MKLTKKRARQIEAWARGEILDALRTMREIQNDVHRDERKSGVDAEDRYAIRVLRTMITAAIKAVKDFGR